MTKNFRKCANFEVRRFVDAFDTQLLKEEDAHAFDFRGENDGIEEMFGDFEA